MDKILEALPKPKTPKGKKIKKNVLLKTLQNLGVSQDSFTSFTIDEVKNIFLQYQMCKSQKKEDDDFTDIQILRLVIQKEYPDYDCFYKFAMLKVCMSCLDVFNHEVERIEFIRKRRMAELRQRDFEES